MIDHIAFTKAYNEHSKWVTYLARKMYRIDPDRIAADTWTRVWSIRERIEAITPALLRLIMPSLVKDRWRRDAVEWRHVKASAYMPKSEWQEVELPQIMPDDLSKADQAIYRRLLSYSRSRQTLRDTGIPPSSLHHFRARLRERFPEEIG